MPLSNPDYKINSPRVLASLAEHARIPSHSSILSAGSEIHPADRQDSGLGMGPRLGPPKECRMVAEGSGRQNPGAAGNQATRPVPCPGDTFAVEHQVGLGTPGHTKLH